MNTVANWKRRIDNNFNHCFNCCSANTKDNFFKLSKQPFAHLKLIKYLSVCNNNSLLEQNYTICKNDHIFSFDIRDLLTITRQLI